MIWNISVNCRPLKTIYLFTPELMDRINQIVVKHVHLSIGNKARKGLDASCDSFVEETNVHFPTAISLSSLLCERKDLE